MTGHGCRGIGTRISRSTKKLQRSGVLQSPGTGSSTTRNTLSIGQLTGSSLNLLPTLNVRTVIFGQGCFGIGIQISKSRPNSQRSGVSQSPGRMRGPSQVKTLTHAPHSSPFSLSTNFVETPKLSIVIIGQGGRGMAMSIAPPIINSQISGTSQLAAGIVSFDTVKFPPLEMQSSYATLTVKSPP